MKHIRTTFLGLFLAVAVLVPAGMVSAQGQATGSDNPRDLSFQIVPCTGVVASSTNAQGQKECDFNQLMVLFNRVVTFLLYLSIPLILGMIMYTAFMFITSNGDLGKLAKAKKMVMPIVIGLFWILGAYVIIHTVLSSLLEDNIDGQPKENVIFLNMFK